jgi:two-component system, OmpR family, sensor kinase
VKVRTRLAASFAYVLLVVIVALTIPLAVVLRDRARSEMEALATTNAQVIAAGLDRDRLDDGHRARLTRDIERYAGDVSGRVVVIDASGTVIADSATEDVGEAFDTAARPEVRTAFEGGVSAQVRRSDEEGGDIVVAAAPVIEEGEVVGVVRTSRSVQALAENVGRATAAIVAVALGGLLAGLLLAAALAGSLARPLSRLAGVARRLGAGELGARAGAVEGGEEVTDLAASFDEMAERLERTVQAQREFVANASHQLRTPLTGLKLRLEAAIAQTADRDVVAELRAADHEVDRLARIIERLLTMATEIEEGRPARAGVGEAIGRAVERWGERARQASSTLAGEPADGVVVADPHDLDQILDVVIDNALTHAPGAIELESEADGARIRLSVRDHGPGIPEDERARVTERFFRGRAAAPGGSGLGLAIASELAERWGGQLRVAATSGGGTVVDVWLPRAGEPVAAG